MIQTVAFVQPTNEAFAEYPPLAFATLEPYGGKVVMRCMTDEDKSKSGPEFMERSTASDFKIGIAIEFPSVEKAMEWKSSDQYQKIINKRLDNSASPFIITEGIGKSIEGGAAAFCLAYVKATGPKFGEYPPKVQETLDPYGGEFLVRCMLGKDANEGGPTFVERSTATDYTVCVLLGFPSVENLHGWHDSKAYQDIIDIRLDNSTGPLIGCKALAAEPWYVSIVKKIKALFIN